jgi:hypothetical protein
VSERWMEGEIRAALEEEYRPAPWLLANSIETIRRARPMRPARAWVAGGVAMLIAIGSIAVIESVRLTQSIYRAPNASSPARTARTTATPTPPDTVGALPAPRVGAALAWNAKEHYMLMFGGATTGADGRNATPNDTWTWVDHQWKLMKTSNAPPGRSNPSMAYDPVRQQVVMFGGGGVNSDALRNDTWAWNGNDWTQLQPTSSPQPGLFARMAYDPVQQALILVRQSVTPGDPLETWLWSGTTWLRVASGTPSPRAGFGLGNDPATGEVMLVGGRYGAIGDSNAPKSDTYTWHKGAWSQKQTGQPSPSDGVATSLDEKRHEAVLFVQQANETWTFDGSKWSKHVPAHGPESLLGGVALGYDSSIGMVLLFGGKTDSNPGTRYLNELWAWDGIDWTRVNPGSSPSPSGGYLPYVSSDWLYSFEYPASWYQLGNFGLRSNLKYFSNQQVSSPMQLASGGIWLTVIVQSESQQACSNGPPGAGISQTPISIDGESTSKLSGASGVGVSLIHAGWCYSISFSTPNLSARDKHDAEIDHILASFRFNR